MSEFVTSRLEIQETAATIAADRRYIAIAVRAIKEARRDVEREIRKDRFFLTTLEPYDEKLCSSATTARMSQASRMAGVGPMATVAGAIAQVAMEAMAAEGCRHGWVDNGGDIAISLDSSVTLEVFTTPGSSRTFGFNLEPTAGIMGICSSSGRLGHSISFGDSDVALVIADNAIIADAFATSLGNEVKSKDSLGTCFDRMKGVSSVKGGLAMIDEEVAVFGMIPELVEVEHNSDALTLHSAMNASKFIGRSSEHQELRT